MDAIIAAWTRRHTKHEAMRAVGEAGIPAGAVLDTMELQNDPRLRAARHHAGDAPPGAPRLQDARLAGADRRQAAGADSRPRCSANIPMPCWASGWA